MNNRQLEQFTIAALTACGVLFLGSSLVTISHPVNSAMFGIAGFACFIAAKCVRFK